MEYLKTSYWKVTQYNELLIKRDKEWFVSVCLPKINEFWEKVLYYRGRPIEEIKALCGSRNSKPYKKPTEDKSKVGLNQVVKEEDKNLITNYIKKETAETTSILFLTDSDSE